MKRNACSLAARRWTSGPVPELRATFNAQDRVETFEANVLRTREMSPFVVVGAAVLNAFEVHVVNKRAEAAVFELRGVPVDCVRYAVATQRLSLRPLQARRAPVFVEYARGAAQREAEIELRMDGQLVRV